MQQSVETRPLVFPREQRSLFPIERTEQLSENYSHTWQLIERVIQKSNTLNPRGESFGDAKWIAFGPNYAFHKAPANQDSALMACFKRHGRSLVFESAHSLWVNPQGPTRALIVHWGSINEPRFREFSVEKRRIKFLYEADENDILRLTEFGSEAFGYHRAVDWPEFAQEIYIETTGRMEPAYINVNHFRGVLKSANKKNQVAAPDIRAAQFLNP